VLDELCAKDPRVMSIRLARNSGSYAAITAGFAHFAGDCAIVLAADGQDPPEVIPELIAAWEQGAKVVWAVRGEREGHSGLNLFASRAFYWTMNHFTSCRMPPEGADFLLADSQVVMAFNLMPERSHSVFAMIIWLGFPQSSISYTKSRRLHGRSKWSFGMKIKLAVDSFIGYSYFPMRAASLLGLCSAALGLLYAVVVTIHGLIGISVPGWSSLMVVLLLTAGVQMLILGVLGEYVWRVLEEVRHRPRYVVEAVRNLPGFPRVDLLPAAAVPSGGSGVETAMDQTNPGQAPQRD
jgi:dolichol-phosphate mannosyltransferase